MAKQAHSEGAGRRPIGQLIAPARFVGMVVAAVLAALAFSMFFEPIVAWIWGFDVGSACFLLSLAPLMHGSGPEEMRRHARENDANRKTLLAGTSIVASVVFCTLAVAVSQTSPGVVQRVSTILTLLLCWLLVNAVYMLHYAHLFYTSDSDEKDLGGIELPASVLPDYFDFAYFALTIGMTFQTSDVQVTSAQIRRVMTLHALVSFIFNLGVLAFAINVIGASSH